MKKRSEASKEKFIIAAVSELEEHGVSDFSMRNVAKRCGVSSAAPYKHFEGKSELILEVIRHIAKKWTVIQRETLEKHDGSSVGEKLVAICVAYTAFLCTYPEYQTIIFMNDRVFPPEMLAEKVKLSNITEELIDEYCRAVGMPEEIRKRKLFTAKSFIYGAAVLINSGAVPFNSETIDIIRANIERELDFT